MTTKNSEIATAVAKRLKRYLDTQRREQAFDLSNLQHPEVTSVGNNLRHGYKLNGVDLKELTKASLLQQEISDMNGSKVLSERERKVKVDLQRQMLAYNSLHVVSPYNHPVVGRVNFPSQKKKKKKRRVTSAGRVRQNRPIHSAPPQRLTKSEHERLLDVTSKLLVATESIALPQEAMKELQTSSEESFSTIPAVRKMQISSRPKSAYSDQGSLLKNTKSSRLNSAEKSESLSFGTSVESLRISTPGHNKYEVKQFDDNHYIVTKKPIKFPSPTLTSSRPKSAINTNSSKYRNRPASHRKNIHKDSLVGNISECDSSFDFNLSTVPKKAWTEENSDFSIEDLRIKGESTENSFVYRSEKTFEGLEELSFLISEQDNSTQTRRRDMPPRVTTYRVYVVTGSKPDSDTKAKVKINLFGEYGNTGDRPLLRSKNNKTLLQRNQVDVFHLDCVHVGKLSSVRVGHDSDSADNGWYLDKIIVSAGENSDTAHEFICKKWLSAHKGDGQIIRDILLTREIPSSNLPPVSYINASAGRRASSASYTSSSDSEAEKEQRQLEKLKRREKRQSRGELTSEKPRANLGGIINKVGHGASRSGTGTAPTKLPNDKLNEIEKSLQNFTTSNSRVYKSSISKGKLIITSPDSTGSVDKVSDKNNVKLLDKNEGKMTENSDVNAPAQQHKAIDNVTERNQDTVISPQESKQNGCHDESEDQLEFSNKDTMKKYSESAATTNDLYMAGFLAGIKASKTKESETEVEARKKQEFEEKIKKGPTIHQACERGDLDRMKELISMVPELKNKADERGWCPVHISAAFGHLDLLKWLAVNDVNLFEQTPTGYTAIHLAAMNGHVNCIMILAAMGCPISSRTIDQLTPIHLTVMSGHIECLKWLLSNRAKIDVKDANGRTPLSMAEEYKHEECIKLLKIMKKELQRKDSVMAMLRDPMALRYPNVDSNEFLLQARGADSGVGADDEEEWVSDTEGTSDVVGRGGDDRSDEIRRTSVQVGRKESLAQKGNKKSSVVSSGKGRRLSKQEIRQNNQLEEKKKMYQKQVKKQAVRKTSFLDSIRSEVDGDDNDF